MKLNGKWKVLAAGALATGLVFTTAIPAHAAVTPFNQSWDDSMHQYLQQWTTQYYKASAGTVSLNVTAAGWPSCGTTFKLGLRVGGSSAQISNSPQWNWPGSHPFSFPGHPPAARDKIGSGHYSLNGRMNDGVCTYLPMPMSGAFTW